MFQGSLLGCAPIAVDSTFATCRRVDLGAGAWIDDIPGWLAGADDVFSDVEASAPWQGRSRIMWDRPVDEPRLSTHGWTDPPDPLPKMAGILSEQYGLDLSAISANWYRDGADSVAWHGDNAGKYRPTTVVAIVSLGPPRPFLIRPKGGGAARRFLPSHGDLVVMGGTCQHRFEHAVPKRAAAGPRISVMFREPGVI